MRKEIRFYANNRTSARPGAAAGDCSSGPDEPNYTVVIAYKQHGGAEYTEHSAHAGQHNPNEPSE